MTLIAVLVALAITYCGTRAYGPISDFRFENLVWNVYAVALTATGVVLAISWLIWIPRLP
jgi:hypothetical protein